jgi:hypothetical protein
MQSLMTKPEFKPNHYYRITFPDGQPIDCKFKGEENDNGSLLFEKKGGETFFLETVEPYEKITEVDAW